MPQELKRLLMVFIKNPERGQVKTRLAIDLGDDKALEVYHKLLEQTRNVSLSVKCSKQLWYASFVDQNDEWPEVFFTKKQQEGSDLGERMKMAFETAFAEDFGKVVIIGGDCPQLDGSTLEEAFARLDDFPVVVGPANDGGYYLLGMNRFYNLFDGIEWSTTSVLNDSIKKMRQLGLKYFKLPELIDLDTIDDYKKLSSL